MGRKREGQAARVRLAFRRAGLLRISAEMERWREANGRQSVRLTQPHLGWIRYVRDALNMNGHQLARRMGIRQPTLARLEQKEREGTVTLGALRRAANALGCELVYSLVPRTSLADVVEAQVRRAVAAVSRHSPTDPRDPEELTRELLVSMPGWIWGSWEYRELYDVGEDHE
jgi:predicted DNA-binding mobile mystery protein A